MTRATDQVINLCFSVQWLSVTHLLLDLLVRSLSQFFSVKIRIREDTTCKMFNTEVEEEEKIGSVQHNAVGSKKKKETVNDFLVVETEST